MVYLGLPSRDKFSMEKIASPSANKDVKISFLFDSSVEFDPRQAMMLQYEIVSTIGSSSKLEGTYSVESVVPIGTGLMGSLEYEGVYIVVPSDFFHEDDVGSMKNMMNSSILQSANINATVDRTEIEYIVS